MILGVAIPPAAEKLRRLANLAQIVQSHALSLLPPVVAGPAARASTRPPSNATSSPSPATHRDVARAGIRLRGFGQEILARLTGKRIHPAWAVPGGVRSPLAAHDARRELAGGLAEHVDATRRAIDLYKRSLPALHEEVRAFGVFPSYFLGLVGPDGAWETTTVSCA